MSSYFLVSGGSFLFFPLAFEPLNYFVDLNAYPNII